MFKDFIKWNKFKPLFMCALFMFIGVLAVNPSMATDTEECFIGAPQDGNPGGNVVFQNNTTNSAYEVIYTKKDMLDVPRTIRNLSLLLLNFVGSAPTPPNINATAIPNVRIYLKNTMDTLFPPPLISATVVAPVPVTPGVATDKNYKLVWGPHDIRIPSALDSIQTFLFGHWQVFNFDSLFEYDGAGSLSVLITREGPIADNGDLGKGLAFGYYATSTQGRTYYTTNMAASRPGYATRYISDELNSRLWQFNAEPAGRPVTCFNKELSNPLSAASTITYESWTTPFGLKSNPNFDYSYVYSAYYPRADTATPSPGGGTSALYLNQKNGVYETIYTATNLGANDGEKKTITHIAFMPNTNATVSGATNLGFLGETLPFRIYLKPSKDNSTTATQGGAAVDSNYTAAGVIKNTNDTSYKRYFSGTYTYSPKGGSYGDGYWIEVKLDTPFVYSGNGNVKMMVGNNQPTATTGIPTVWNFSGYSTSNTYFGAASVIRTRVMPTAAGAPNWTGTLGTNVSTRFRYEKPYMKYAGITGTPVPTDSMRRLEKIYDLLKININTTLVADPLIVKSMKFDASGSTPGVLKKATLYYTNNINSFSTSTVFGTYTFPVSTASPLKSDDNILASETEFTIESNLSNGLPLLPNQDITPYDVSNHYFWLEYEAHDGSPSQSDMTVALVGTEMQTASNRSTFENPSDLTPAQQDATRSNIELTYLPVGFVDMQRDYSICADEEKYIFTASIENSIQAGGISWYRATTQTPIMDNGNIVGYDYNWTALSSEDVILNTKIMGKDITTSRLTFKKSPSESIADNYIYYTCRAEGPYNEASTVPSSVDSVVLNITYENPIASVIISTANTDLQSVAAGDIVTFSSEILGKKNIGIPYRVDIYRWQLNNTGVWFDIDTLTNKSATTYVDNAGNRMLDLKVDYTNNYGQVRLIAEQHLFCDVVVKSNTITFAVKTEKLLISEEPQPYTELCLVDSLKLSVAHRGDKISGKWYKDGNVLTTVDSKGNTKTYTDPVLKLAGKDKNGNGEDLTGTYYYSITGTVKVKVGDAGDVYEDLIVVENSHDAKVYVIHPTTITTQQQSRNYAELGGATIFTIEANHVGITPPYYSDQYQWYRRSANGRRDTLRDSEKYSGATANVLVINNIESTDFTHDNAYYYCEVFGRCDKAISDSVFLFKAEEVAFANQPVDASPCAGTDVSLNCLVSPTTKEYVYQWYKNAVKLENNAHINGVKTSTLNIISVDVAKDNGEYHVEVYPKDIPSNTLSSEKASVTVKHADITDKLYADGTTHEIEVEDGKNAVIFDYTIDADVTVACKYSYKTDKGVEYDSIATERTGFKIELIAADTNKAGKYIVEISSACGKTTDTVVVSITNTPVAVDPEPTNSIVSDVTELNLQPNPTKGTFSLSYNSISTLPIRIELLDIAGSRIRVLFDGTPNVGKNHLEYNLLNNNISTGTYLLNILQNGKNISSHKLIFQP